jgi:hypothetical protein
MGLFTRRHTKADVRALKLLHKAFYGKLLFDTIMSYR